MYREQHKERKAQVVGIIEKAKECCELLGYTDKVEIFEELKRATEEDEFSIVVVGEFSAGKSTFLNALMGKCYLPSFTSETTATVNFLMGNKGGEENAVIHYKEKDKDTLVVPATMENIKKYAAVNKEISVAKSIEKVELQLNSNFLNDGVMLIDSPGLNGLEEGHREITETQIEKSHACIFVFSAEQPGRRTDFEFLHEIKSKVNRIFLVLNKIDVIKPNEQTVEEVMEKLCENYHKQFPDEELPEIWPLAAYPALVARDGGNLDYNGKTEHSEAERQFYLQKSQMEAFETRLWKFLTEGEKTRDALLEPVKRVEQLIIPLIAKEKAFIEEMNKHHDSDEVQEQIDALQREKAELDEKLKKDDTETKDVLDLKIRDMEASIEAKIQQVMKTYTRQLETAQEIDDFHEIRENLNQTANRDVQKIMKKVHREFVDGMQEVVRQRYRNYYHNLENQIDGLSFNNNVKVDQIREMEIDFGFEDYDEKMEKIRQEVTELENKIEVAQEDYFQAIQYEMEKDELKAEIKRIEDRKMQMIATLGERPMKRSYTVSETRQVRNSKIGQFFFGDKYKEFQITKNNDDEIAAYAAERAAIEAQYAREETELREQLKGMSSSSNNSELYKEKQLKIERIQQEKKMEMENLRREQQEKFKLVRDKEARKLKAQIMATIDEMETDIKENLYVEMRSRRNDLLHIIKDIVEKNIREQYEQKEVELKRLQNTLKESIEEKEAKIAESQNKVEKLEALQAEVGNIMIDLNMIEVDEIKCTL